MKSFADMYNYDDLQLSDKENSVIIDIGSKYTKVGYTKESQPRDIINTYCIYNYELYYDLIVKECIKILDDTKNDINCNIYKNFDDKNSVYKEYIVSFFLNVNIKAQYNSNIRNFKIDLNDKIIQNQIEDFVNFILVNSLQLHKKRKDKMNFCYLIFDYFNMDEEFISIIVYYLLKSNLITFIKVLNSADVSIYSSGYVSGIVVNMSHLSCSIVPVKSGCINQNCLIKVPFTAVDLEVDLLKRVIQENYISENNLKGVELMLHIKPLYKHLNELLVKSIICINKEMSDLIFNDYYSTNNNLSKSNLSLFKTEYNKVDNYKDIKEFKISLYSRIILGERLFNSDERSYDKLLSNNTVNIAKEILNCILKMPVEDRCYLCRNILLSGGITNTLGLYKRLKEEIYQLIENDCTYNCIKAFKDKINIHKIIYPRNILSWVGCMYK